MYSPYFIERNLKKADRIDTVYFKLPHRNPIYCSKTVGFTIIHIFATIFKLKWFLYCQFLMKNY